MKRLMAALVAGLAAWPATAGEMFYLYSKNSWTYAVNQQTSATRLVFPGGSGDFTRYNHAGSNGQAQAGAAGTNPDWDLTLRYRQPDGSIAIKWVTSLAATGLKPLTNTQLGQNDDFFSFMARDGAGRNTLWRLNVTVDQALDPDYVAPTSYEDPRLQLLLDESSTPGSEESRAHTWNPDGSRYAYTDYWYDAAGTRYIGIRVKTVGDGSTDPASGVLLRSKVATVIGEAGHWQGVLDWAPVGDMIMNCDAAGGVWVVYADSPGAFSWVAQNKVVTKGKTTTTEALGWAKWRPDGQKIGVSYSKTTASSTGTTTVYYPAEIDAAFNPTGWKPTLFFTGQTAGWHWVRGWTP
jgi:hypothetical protein